MMNLWLSSHLLVAGLFLSSSALTPEECQPLVSPLSLAEPSMMYGRWNYIAAYTETEVFTVMLNLTESAWMTASPSPSDPNEVVVFQEDKLNGTCLSSHANISIDGNTASSSFANISSVFHLLPTCDGCMLMNINSTVTHLDKLLQVMKFNSKATEEEVHVHMLYLMAKESTLKDSDLEEFRKQASCLGFSGEPHFLYDPKNDFCAEGEGVDLTKLLN